MTLQFRDPTEEGPPHPNVLLYGPPKSGKTAGAWTVPGHVLAMNLDLPNATHFARRREQEDSRVLEVKYEGFGTLADVTHAVQENAGSLIDSVIVDPVADLHRRLLEEFSAGRVRPTLDQYGDASTYIERFCRKLCELPVNVVIVCHELTQRNEATGAIESLPFTGVTSNSALANKLMAMVDVIGYTGVVIKEDGSKEYAATLVTNQGRRGGDRFDVLGDWKSLDLAEWFAAVEEQETNEPESAQTAAQAAEKE